MCTVVATGTLLTGAPLAAGNDMPPEAEVREGMLRAASAFSELSYKGGYPYLISGDLDTRYNSGHGALRPFPDETYLTMEPPGTPWVGRTFLRAWRATNNPRFLDMAKEVGDALAAVQLAVGGWRMRQPLSDAWADRNCDAPGSYRVTPQADFDDNRSQGPTRFLVELVRDGSTSEHHRAAMDKALEMLLEAQYPSGGWPQYYPLETNGHSDMDSYRRYNHINDASIPDCMRALLAAYEAFGNQKYLDAAVRAADWLLAVRVPGAAWAQQYYDDFVKGPLKPNHPAPGRWFEPMAVTASETGSVVAVLSEVARITEDDRYIAPFSEVADWYERSRLDDGRWARFYELHTNRPLYCTPDRIITYADDNLRPGYAWKGGWGDAVIRAIERIQDPNHDTTPTANRLEKLGSAAREALDALDERGLWVVARGPEDENIRCDEFNRRMAQLCAYIEALSAREE
ncbi:MAG: pectate lyase [Candidatus Hydrogenedentota bacterium]